MTVLDLSNWDYSTYDPVCLRANGVDRAILGCWDRDKTADMTRRNRAAGIATEDLYAFVYYRLAWERREVDNALAIARDLGGIRRIWIDCESQFTEWPGDVDTEAPGTTAAQRIQITAAVETQIEGAGIEPDIYTGESWWRSNMGNTSIFSDRKLWLPNYGTNNPDHPRPPIRAVNFGGWTRTSAHQYSSTIRVCNRERDHNYWFIESEDDAMTPAERKELEDLKLAVFAGSERGDDVSRADRLAVANDYIAERADAKKRSVADVAESAQVNLDGHEADHPGGGNAGGTVTGTFTGTIQ